jgi:hypothetical protein
METFLLASALLVFYVHIFNQIAKMYFDSDQMKLVDVYRHFIPPTSIEISL